MRRNRDKQFNRDLNYGKKGERFFDRYVGSLLRAPVFVRGQSVRAVEGGDYYYIQEGRTSSRNSFAEVKTYSNLSILKFGNKEHLTIPFELSSYEAGTDQTGKQWRPGWGLQILHWERYNEYAEANGLRTRAVRPSTLAYLFCESDRHDMVQPFVCIAFENFDETRKKIVEAAKKYLGFDIDDWDLIIDKKDALWKDKKGHVLDNAWNILFEELFDKTTTVTMIDSEPSEESIIKLNGNILKKDAQYQDMIIQWRRSRLIELQAAANGRHFSSSAEEEALRRIEEMVGCTVHKVPTILSNSTGDASILETLSKWQQELEEQLKQQEQQEQQIKEFVEVYGHYPWLYFF